MLGVPVLPVREDRSITRPRLIMLLERDRHGFFDDLANYLICLVSLTLTFELYITGKSEIYAPDHTLIVDGKHSGISLIFYPTSLLDPFFGGTWPTQLRLEAQPVTVPADAKLSLGILERPVHAFAQEMLVTYFERNLPLVKAVYGESHRQWPPEWDFARVVRNSVAHSGRIRFLKTSSPSVSWRGLTYAATDNGRHIHDDLWTADLIILLLDMDKAISERRMTVVEST